MNTQKLEPMYLALNGRTGPFHADGVCVRCGNGVTPAAVVMLELDQRVGEYHDFQNVPAGQSQGWFVFGATCAEVLRRRARVALDALLLKLCTAKRTLRQHLDVFGGPDHVAMDDYTRSYCLDTPMDEAWFCSDTKDAGRLFVICSGYCLMGFKQDSRYRGCLYLVFDDEAGNTWDVLRRSGQDLHAVGPRPSPRLRLVQSA